MKREHMNRIAEFLLIGIFMGVTEDLLAVKLTTGANLDFRVIGIVILVSLPFAVFSELVVDKEDFTFFKKNKD
ncbi:MAG: hypothetical protein ABEK17_02580 [Candidatus Aenigmatarchaeota archaeon]